MKEKSNNYSKSDAEALNDALKDLPYKEYQKVISDIVVGCKIAKYTFKNWRYNRCRIPELAKDKIEEIMGKPIFKRNTNE